MKHTLYLLSSTLFGCSHKASRSSNPGLGTLRGIQSATKLIISPKRSSSMEVIISTVINHIGVCNKIGKLHNPICNASNQL